MTPQELFDKMVDFGKTNLMEQDGLTLMIHAVPKEGKDIVIAVPGGFPPGMRDVIYPKLRQIFAAAEVQFYGTCAECWFAVISKEERAEHPDADFAPPSEREDRKECLAVSVVIKNDRPIHKIFEILRHEGRIVGFKDEPVVPGPIEFSGPMMELLGPIPHPQ